ncbi:hypothetical protein BST97_11110 [Nonlabens spongiae]|uniref:Antitoxin SocA-like Panacea domain-containing protein n=1 Tax=Nonlabens spongiae TaxID=331648 RepID=A0A1W6MLL1_9FLAO|nr:Panacea domain-containing protein [Nonlabens spongiae]ARN78491.1 hypothetical protein BST97_11110 [Nonlabens spongiae]
MKSIIEEHLVILHSLLFLLNRAEKPIGRHKLFKMMYFAEKKSLATYGRPLTTDRYVAMKYGPVPSIAYRFIQTLEGNDNYMSDYIPFLSSHLELMNDHKVSAKSHYDPDELSQSDIQFLEESFDENYHLSFTELTEKSHDLAWNSADKNTNMSTYEIAKAAGATDDTISYLLEFLELQKSSLITRAS